MIINDLYNIYLFGHLTLRRIRRVFTSHPSSLPGPSAGDPGVAMHRAGVAEPLGISPAISG